jgi:phosphodiesterase/alkaline phosphatase D-like protein
MLSRRRLLEGATALPLGGLLFGGVAWSAGNSPVRALLPSAHHDALAVKLLLDRPPSAPPVLSIDGRPLPGRPAEPDGYAWTFVQRGLKPATAYRLALVDGAGKPLRPDWQLKTLPAPDALPERFRILFFTCAGGDEAAGGFHPHAIRQALLDRALAFRPDLAVANGDHVYWDQETALVHRGSAERRARTEELYRRIAWIERDQAFDSVTNRQAVNTVAGRQIAALYEDRFAAVPLVFVADDHDYYENDNGGDWGYAFPPGPLQFGLHQRTRALAYPERFGVPSLPGGPWQAETVEAIRIGRLVELALVDCRRGWDTTAPDGGVLFPDVERWLTDRLAASPARHLVFAPSNPMGWTAGKIGEWYGDRPPAGVTDSDKAWWRPGWFEQHQRLLAALGRGNGTPAITISGDLHAIGAAQIVASDTLDLGRTPIEAIIPGPISTANGWPSIGRGMFPRTPERLRTEDRLLTEERNGFTLVDFTPDSIEVRQFRWRPPEPVAAIASLEPFGTYRIQRDRLRRPT